MLEINELILFLYSNIRYCLLKQKETKRSGKIRWISTPIFIQPYNISQRDKSHYLTNNMSQAAESGKRDGLRGIRCMYIVRRTILQ